MPYPWSDARAAALEFRRGLLAHNRLSQRRLLRQFGRYHRTITAEVGRLNVVLAASGDLSPAEVQRLVRWQELDRQVRRAALEFATEWGDELERAAIFSADLGSQAALAESLSGYAIGDHQAINVVWNRLPTQAIIEGVGFFEPGSPLTQRLASFPSLFAQHLEAGILEGLALGYNPQKVARAVAKATGETLDWASRWTRTTHLQAYRGAHRESFRVNSDVVGTWVWTAALGPQICASCVAMHGTEHPITESLDDHWNGLCVPIPKVLPVAGVQPLPLRIEDSEAWFAGLDQAEQERIAGKSMRDHYINGRVDLRKWSKEVDDRVWGTMRVPTSLKDHGLRRVVA